MTNTKILDAIPSSALVATGLAGGFGVASTTKNRPLGGVVLATCGVLAGRKWLRQGGPGITGVLTGVYLASFVGSHKLAKKIGAWPSVFVVTAASAGASWALSDRH